MKAVVIERYKDNGVITSYKICPKGGVSRFVPADELRDAVKSGKVELTNFKLSTNNRLIPSVKPYEVRSETCFVDNGTGKQKQILETIEVFIKRQSH